VRMEGELKSRATMFAEERAAKHEPVVQHDWVIVCIRNMHADVRPEV
jgi:hypothetical protein